MAKASGGGKINFNPHLDKPKNMPGDMPLMNKKFSGGKGPKQGGGDGKKGMGGTGGEDHGLHGAAKAPKGKAKKK